MIGELVPYLRGWAGYFSFSQSRELPSLDGWIRRRLRCVAWVQWKTRGQRSRRLGQCGHFQLKGTLAVELFGSLAPRLHQSPFRSSRIASNGETGGCLIRRTAVVRTRMPGGVGGVASRDVPLSRLTERARRKAAVGRVKRHGAALLSCVAQIVHVEVAMLLEPVLVGLDRQCPDEPQAALAIGENAHDMGATPDLLV